MKVRSPSTQAAQAAGAQAPASEVGAKARGQKLLGLAADRPLAAQATLGVAQTSMDVLSRSLLEGALLSLESRTATAKD